MLQDTKSYLYSNNNIKFGETHSKIINNAFDKDPKISHSYLMSLYYDAGKEFRGYFIDPITEYPDGDNSLDRHNWIINSGDVIFVEKDINELITPDKADKLQSMYISYVFYVDGTASLKHRMKSEVYDELEGKNIVFSVWAKPISINENDPPEITLIIKYNIGEESSGGGCPYLYIWNGEKFIVENNLLRYSEHLNYSEVIDHYVLKNKPFIENNRILLRIGEYEYSKDFIDLVRLVRIFNPLNEVVITDNTGNYYLFNPNSTFTHKVDKAIGEYFANVTFLLKDDDNKPLVLYPEDKVVLVFNRTKDYLYRQFTMKKYYNWSTGLWDNITIIEPRSYWDYDLLDVTNIVKRTLSLGITQVFFKIISTQRHKIDVVYLASPPAVHPAPIIAVSKPVIAIKHSINNSTENVLHLIRKSDNEYVMIKPNEYVDIQFRASIVDKLFQKYVDYILVVEGYYKPLTSPYDPVIGVSKTFKLTSTDWQLLRVTAYIQKPDSNEHIDYIDLYIITSDNFKGYIDGAHLHIQVDYFPLSEVYPGVYLQPQLYISNVKYSETSNGLYTTLSVIENIHSEVMDTLYGAQLTFYRDGDVYYDSSVCRGTVDSTNIGGDEIQESTGRDLALAVEVAGIDVSVGWAIYTAKYLPGTIAGNVIITLLIGATPLVLQELNLLYENSYYIIIKGDNYAYDVRFVAQYVIKVLAESFDGGSATFDMQAIVKEWHGNSATKVPSGTYSVTLTITNS